MPFFEPPITKGNHYHLKAIIYKSKSPLLNLERSFGKVVMLKKRQKVEEIETTPIEERKGIWSGEN
ncbi:hypothetical protein GCM10008986_24880 [Salinibacillus aidingensis]|uniref:Uncharacterized protein n=1 Tax=Salinibacillus aidingensis TaxID=237684 RepID=A0ABN1BFR4_9BACI